MAFSVSTRAPFLSISCKPIPAAAGAEKAPNTYSDIPPSLGFVDLMPVLGATKSLVLFSVVLLLA